MTNVSFTDVTRFVAAAGGTGSFVVSAAVTGYQTPLTAGASNFNYRYRAESSDLSQWEVGTGAYTSSNVTLTRTPIFNSAGGSSAINFTNPPQVAFVFLSEDFNATGQIPGTNTNDNGNSGVIGEFVSATLSTGAAVTFTISTPTPVVTLTLPSGDWHVWSLLNVFPISGAAQTLVEAGVTASSTARPVSPNGGSYLFDQQAHTAGAQFSYPVGQSRISTSISQNIFLMGFVQWTGSSTSFLQGNGFIGARRAR